MTDIRWRQRFNSYIKALRLFDEILEIEKKRELSKTERLGMIQAFEITYELSWNLLKDYLVESGIMVQPQLPKQFFQEAFKRELITHGEVWIDMVTQRNKTSHVYDEDLAKAVKETILKEFYPAFKALEKTFTIYYEQSD